jgi:hypothetical protein
MDSCKIRFSTKNSTDGMNEEIGKALKQLSARAHNRSLKIKSNLVAATAVLEMDEHSLKHVRDELDKLKNDYDPIKIQVKPELALGSTTLVNKRLELLTRPRKVPLLPEVNNAAALKAGPSATQLGDNADQGANSTVKFVGDSGATLQRAWVQCADGKTAIGGGYQRADVGVAAIKNLQVVSSSPTQVKDGKEVYEPIAGDKAGSLKPNAWLVEGFKNGTTDLIVRPSVVCANIG